MPKNISITSRYAHLIKSLSFIFLLSLIGCGNQEKGNPQTQVDPLRMEVSTKDVNEVDKTIKVSIMLAEDVQSADLNNFQLRIGFLDGESSSNNRFQYRNAT